MTAFGQKRTLAATFGTSEERLDSKALRKPSTWYPSAESRLRRRHVQRRGSFLRRNRCHFVRGQTEVAAAPTDACCVMRADVEHRIVGACSSVTNSFCATSPRSGIRCDGPNRLHYFDEARRVRCIREAQLHLEGNGRCPPTQPVSNPARKSTVIFMNRPRDRAIWAKHTNVRFGLKAVTEVWNPPNG